MVHLPVLTCLLGATPHSDCGQKIQTSVTGRFEGEAKTVMNQGSKYGPKEKKAGNLYKFKAHTTRFIRYFSARSNKNAGVHMVEIDVYGLKTPMANKLWKNLDQLKGITIKNGPGMKGDPKKYIDMNHSPGSWTKSPNGNSKSCADSRYVEIDLKDWYELHAIRVWNYYGDTRRYCGQKLELSTSGQFAKGDTTTVMNTGTKWGPTEKKAGNLYKFKPTVARFVRYYSSRSNKNAGVHMVEIDVLGMPSPMPHVIYKPLDQMKGVTVTKGPGMVGGITKRLIDMNHSPGSWRTSPYGSSKGCTDSRYVTIDLGNYYTVQSVRVWNYYGDTGRRYCGQKLQVSSTGAFGKEAKTVMNHGTKYGPVENQGGNLYKFKPTVARYVRYSSARSNKNTGVHMVEIDVYGIPTPMPNALYVNLDQLKSPRPVVKLGPGLRGTAKNVGLPLP